MAREMQVSSGSWVGASRPHPQQHQEKEGVEEVAPLPLLESGDWVWLGQGHAPAAVRAPKQWPALGQPGHRAASP